jgi:hypothetical protein
MPIGRNPRLPKAQLSCGGQVNAQGGAAYTHRHQFPKPCASHCAELPKSLAGGPGGLTSAFNFGAYAQAFKKHQTSRTEISASG